MRASITTNVIVETHSIDDAEMVRDLLNVLQVEYDEYSGNDEFRNTFTITREIKYFE